MVDFPPGVTLISSSDLTFFCYLSFFNITKFTGLLHWFELFTESHSAEKSEIHCNLCWKLQKVDKGYGTQYTPQS